MRGEIKMQEKDMVNDILSTLNSSITGYANVISQASNPQFRQTIQQIRDNCETFQYDLYKVAEQKGYYMPAQQANMNEIQQVKSMFGG
jgi:spore coat protein CotF